MSEKSEENTIPDYVVRFFDFVFEKYEPATICDATIKKTTKEIFEEMQLHCPGRYGQDDVVKLLQEHNFISNADRNDFHFEWLMKAAPLR